MPNGVKEFSDGEQSQTGRVFPDGVVLDGADQPDQLVVGVGGKPPCVLGMTLCPYRWGWILATWVFLKTLEIVGVSIMGEG